MQKRGQITAYIIIGILIVILAGSTILIKDYFLKTDLERELAKAKKVPHEIKPIKEYFDSCLTKISKEAVNSLGVHAGYIEIPPDPLPRTYLNPFSNRLEVVPGLEVPYWFYETSNGIQKEQIPTLEDMQNQLNKEISRELENCIDGLTNFEDQGFSFEILSDQKVETEIHKEKVLIRTNLPIKIIHKDTEYAPIEDHMTSIESPLGELYTIALNIIEEEKKTNFLEEKTIDVMVTYDKIPLSGIYFECKEKIWLVEDIIKNLKEFLNLNIGALKLKGTDYFLTDPSHKYFVLDVKADPTITAGFTYSQNWPLFLEVVPEEGGILKSDQISSKMEEALPQLAARALCMYNYQFIYDIKYPVLITLTKDDYVFQFSYLTIIDNNQPKKAVITKDIPSTELPICDNPTTKINVYTFTPTSSGDLISLPNTEITFQCLNKRCPLGSTTSESKLETFVPACLNSLIIAEKPNYYKATSLVSTNQETSISLILEPLIKKQIRINLIEKEDGTIRSLFAQEKVILQFKNKDNDYSQTIIYPDQTQVTLMPGNYEIKTYVIIESISKIKTQPQKIKKCISVPRPNLLGLFFKEEKCFESELESMELDQVTTGGAVFDYEITRLNLEDPSDLVIFTMVDKIPSTLDEIILVQQTINENANHPYFKYPI
jgi:hypothetical protein